jgi:nitrite reductase (NADH) small subunit
MMPDFIKVANKNELKPGENKIVLVHGKKLGLFNVNGEFFAISNHCPHRGGSLGEGMLEGDTVSCPLHGWQFNVKTGQSPVMPQNVPCYQVKVEGDDVFISLD